MGRGWWLAPVLVPLLVFREALIGSRIVAPGDGHTYYLPLSTLVADHWRSGAFPGWDRGTFAGSPLFAVHQSAALHPTTLAYIALPPVVAHNLSVISALVVAGLGTFVLTRRITGDPVGAAVAGCAFGLCGFQFAQLGHVSVLATTAWLPWLLWSADRVRERLDVRRAAMGAAVVALAALSGHGQMLAFGLAVTLGVTLVASIGRRAGAALARVAVVVVVGLGLAAVQLVPVIASIGASDRSGLTHRQATAFSHEPESLLVLVFPFLYGNARSEGPVTSAYLGPWTLTELGGYVGTAALVLAVVGLPRVRADRRLRGLVVVAGLSVLVALGDTTPLSRVVHALPGFGQMRSWARYTVVAQLAVAVLAGVGVSRARSSPAALRLAPVAAGAVGAAALTALLPALAPARVTGPELVWAIGQPLAAALAALAVLGLLRARPTRSGLGAVLLVVLVSLDAVVGFGWWFRWRSASPTPATAEALVTGDAVPRWGEVPDAPGGVDRYLWIGNPLLANPNSPRVESAAGSASVTGMDPLAPADYLEVTGTDYFGRLDEPDDLLAPDSHLLDLLRVTLLAAPSGDGVARQVREPSLDEAFVVGRTRMVSRAEAVAAATGRAPLDPAREAVIDQGCAACPDTGRAGSPGTAGPVDRRRNASSIDVDADRPALLVISEAWDRGWSASVDGAPAPVVQVDGVIQGVPIPAGHSTVELRYRPPGLRIGASITGLTALALAIALWRNRRQRHDSSQSRHSSASGVRASPVHTG